MNLFQQIQSKAQFYSLRCLNVYKANQCSQLSTVSFTMCSQQICLAQKSKEINSLFSSLEFILYVFEAFTELDLMMRLVRSRTPHGAT